MWSVDGDPLIWADLLNVILYARSSYYHDNMLIYIPFSDIFLIL